MGLLCTRTKRLRFSSVVLSISTKCGSRVCSARAQNACDSLRWLFLFQRNAGQGFALHAHKALAIPFDGSFQLRMRVKGLLCTRTKRLRFPSVALSNYECGSKVCSARGTKNVNEYYQPRGYKRLLCVVKHEIIHECLR